MNYHFHGVKRQNPYKWYWRVIIEFSRYHNRKIYKLPFTYMSCNKVILPYVPYSGPWRIELKYFRLVAILLLLILIGYLVYLLVS